MISSWDGSLNSRPIGTRCTAGGDDAGDIPKNRFNKSLKGSDGLKPNDDIDMSNFWCGMRVGHGFLWTSRGMSNPVRDNHHST
ncbi:hypothetical protein [Streptomyces acidiscabies]|uniref:hypothetical protein n=1 Tax=Streptomyces acidiscabies TaxID=42234 RepID=UPI0038F80220